MEKPRIIMNLTAFTKLSAASNIKITHYERDSFINDVKITLLPPLPELQELDDEDSIPDPTGYPV